MKHKYYAIYDRLAQKYVHVFENENDKTAARLFEVMEKTPENFVNLKPEDYQLDYIGEFNDENGEFKNEKEGLKAPYKILEGKPHES